MPESKHEAIAAALTTVFAGIVGDGGATYWYSVDRAVRVPMFHGGCLDSSLTTIYCLAPDDEEDELAGETFTDTGSHMIVDVTAVTKFTPSSENPFTADTPLRWTVQNRLIRDVKKAARANLTVGGAMNIRFPLTSRKAQETYVTGWAIAHLRLQIEYDYVDSSP